MQYPDVKAILYQKSEFYSTLRVFLSEKRATRNYFQYIKNPKKYIDKGLHIYDLITIPGQI